MLHRITAGISPPTAVEIIPQSPWRGTQPPLAGLATPCGNITKMLSYPHADDKAHLPNQASAKVLNGLPEAARREFNANLIVLETIGKLEFPDGRKLNHGLFEVRVAEGGNAYRTMYCYSTGDEIWMLCGFQKKTQETPEREIDKAKAIMRRNGL